MRSSRFSSSISKCCSSTSRCFSCISSPKWQLATFLIAAMTFATTFSSCKHTVLPTSVTVKDSLRHYYPVIQHDELKLDYEITNNGTETLVITDVLPSCSAITIADKVPEIIPPGKSDRLHFIYHSEMNLGYVSHAIRIYGNILPEGVCELEFDVHVVRPTLDRSDYEEIFFDKQAATKELVDGDQGQKGYWVGDGINPEDYSRFYNNPWNN